MRSVILGSLRRHTRRYVAASLAVVIGVAFVVITNALSSSATNGMTADVGAPYEGADTVITGVSTQELGRLMATGNAAPVGYAPVAAAAGDRHLASDVALGSIATDPDLRWQQLHDGRFPTGAGEAVVDVNAAKSNHVGLGDVVTLRDGSTTTNVTVVGTTETESSGSTPIAVTWPDLRPYADRFLLDSLAWSGSDGAARGIAPSATLTESDRFVQDRQAEIARGVDYLATGVLLFVAIAMFVAIMVIANTFSILFAQRMREFALLRCVGATRRQVGRSVRLEALVLGVVSSLVGVGLGVGLGYGLVALIGRFWPQGMGAVELSPVWLIGALLAGVLVSLTAAWWPTRTVLRVSPLAALRPDAGVDVHTSAGRVRIGAGVVLVALGFAVLGYAVATAGLPAMFAGGAATFLGVLLLGPLLVPALIRLAGLVLGRVLGPAGRLATSNATRNPRRTATTAASLLVGVTLTSAMLTGLASSNAAIDKEMDVSHPIDGTVTAIAGGPGLAPDTARRAQASPLVDHAVAIDGTTAQAGEGRAAGRYTLLGVDQRAGDVLPAGNRLITPRPGTVYVPFDLLPDRLLGKNRLTVRVGDEKVRLRIEFAEGIGEAMVVSRQTLERLAPEPTTGAVWASMAPDAKGEDFAGDLAALAPAGTASSAAEVTKRQWVELQVQVFTGAVVGLLAIAIVIALIGIANTLGLSVLERARENAMLRAVGLTRRQLRTAMTTEGILLAAVAALLGTGLGVFFGWVGVEVMVAEVTGGGALVVPVGQLALGCLGAALAGLLACVVPARRAGRVSPAAGLTLD